MQAGTTSSGRRLRSVLFPVAILFGAVLPAQMSGAYTVDRLSTGSRNFRTLNDASLALVKQGVSGSVTVEVASDTYKEAWIIVPMKGVSATNRVTFKSKVKHGAKVEPTNAKANGILVLALGTSTTPVSYLTIDGFEFTPA